MKEEPNPAEYGQGNSPKSIKTMTQQRRNENYPIQNNCLEVHHLKFYHFSPTRNTI
ncbi:hypothetical protein NC652_021549 [Populus alba x Populus x berolinensis]|nr:hypothetical protein NC652_021549 [Populus alba x Populus x berolinensis]